MLRYKRLLLEKLNPDIPPQLINMGIVDLLEIVQNKYPRKNCKKLDRDTLLKLAAGSTALRDIARSLKMPVPSLHNYVSLDVLPRVENIQKIADYFNESISSMFSEDDDLTAVIVAAVRMLPDAEKINYVNHVKKLGAKKCR